MLFSILYGSDLKPAESRRMSAARIFCPSDKKSTASFKPAALKCLVIPKKDVNFLVARFYGEDITV